MAKIKNTEKRKGQDGDIKDLWIPLPQGFTKYTSTLSNFDWKIQKLAEWLLHLGQMRKYARR